MHFRPRKKRSAPSVIIVSLIDVLMVVLIFLVVSATFRERIPALDLTLPTSRQAGSSATGTEDTLLVRIAKTAPHLQLNNKTITLSELRNALFQRARKKPTVSLTIQADEKAPFGEVVSVRDAAEEAGITNIHAQVKLPKKR